MRPRGAATRTGGDSAGRSSEPRHAAVPTIVAPDGMPWLPQDVSALADRLVEWCAEVTDGDLRRAYALALVLVGADEDLGRGRMVGGLDLRSALGLVIAHRRRVAA